MKPKLEIVDYSANRVIPLNPEKLLFGKYENKGQKESLHPWKIGPAILYSVVNQQKFVKKRDKLSSSKSDRSSCSTTNEMIDL